MEESLTNNSLSKVISATGNVVKYARSFKNEFLDKAQAMDLKTLVDEYAKTKEAIDKAKMRVRVELEEVRELGSMC